MKDYPIKGVFKAAAITALACAATAPAALAQNKLVTKLSHELGATFTDYKYTEPGVMSIKARKVGLEYSGTYAFGSSWPSNSQGWFVRGDLRYATGKGDYNSLATGSLNNRPDRYYEVRGLIGKDFEMDGYVLAPYAGLGYRHLFNDLRGVTTTGALGYRRESTYTSLPIGVVHRMHLSGEAQLHTTVEYSHLLRGRQESKLSDAGPALRDVTLRQRNGHGLRLSTMVKFDTWSVGPTLSVWRIKQSDTGGTPPVFEPRNNSYEFGIKAAYHF